MSASTSHLIAPHGGELVNLLASPEKAAELKAHSREWPSWDLTPRQICDLELLMSGGFSPLRGFMTKADYESVCHKMRLASGVLWPMPITLDVTEEFAKKLTPGSSKVALRDPEGVMLAVLHVEEVWQPDRAAEAKAVFNSTSKAHPGADYTMNKANPWYVGGRSKVCRHLRTTISECCASRRRNCGLNSRGWDGAAWLPFRRAIPCTARMSN